MGGSGLDEANRGVQVMKRFVTLILPWLIIFLYANWWVFNVLREMQNYLKGHCG